MGSEAEEATEAAEAAEGEEAEEGGVAPRPTLRSFSAGLGLGGMEEGWRSGRQWEGWGMIGLL